MGTVSFAQNAIVREIQLDNSVYQISKEKLDQIPPLIVCKVNVQNPAQDIDRFCFSAALTEDRKLKYLSAILECSDDFIASGEFEWQYPSEGKLSMYGRTTSRKLNNGKMEYTIRFFMNEEDFYNRSSLMKDSYALLRIYSKEGGFREFKTPLPAFMALLKETAE
jgi:hypothetical protein